MRVGVRREGVCACAQEREVLLKVRERGVCVGEGECVCVCERECLRGGRQVCVRPCTGERGRGCTRACWHETSNHKNTHTLSHTHSACLQILADMNARLEKLVDKTIQLANMDLIQAYVSGSSVS